MKLLINLNSALAKSMNSNLKTKKEMIGPTQVAISIRMCSRVARNSQWGELCLGVWGLGPQPPEAGGLGAKPPALENFAFFLQK